MAGHQDTKKKIICGNFTPTFIIIALFFFILSVSCRKYYTDAKNTYHEKPANRIISLYSAHTENLFALGLTNEVIGVYKSDKTLKGAKDKQAYDYRDDPEKIIEASPDLVLIRPFIERGYPNFINTLRNLNIKVVSLYPDTIDDFDDYIMTLGKLTGKEKQAKKMLKEFNDEIANIKKRNQKEYTKVRVFFESTRQNYRTISPCSLPDNAIKIAGGVNIAEDAIPIKKGSSIAAYGEEKILEKAHLIDVYIAQKGRMNPIVSGEEISSRPGFGIIKAVKERRVYIIEENIISRPTFNYIKGVRMLANIFYGEY